MFNLCTTKQTISIINSKNKKGAQIKPCKSSPHGINLAGRFLIDYTRKNLNKGRHIVCLKSKKKQDEVFNSAFFLPNRGNFPWIHWINQWNQHKTECRWKLPIKGFKFGSNLKLNGIEYCIALNQETIIAANFNCVWNIEVLEILRRFPP